MPLTIRSCRAFGASVLVLLLLIQSAAAQPQADPQREQLLNGLNVLFWVNNGSPDVLLKLRIHSGAAFDLAGKSGEMSLLADLLFPDQATLDFFVEEMKGKLDVRVTYDSVTITMLGKAAEFEQIVQVLRNAILATQLSPELVGKFRDARLKIVRDTAISPAIVADRAISARLFGDFPYGRPIGGSAEDLARVERADLMLAHERFLNSNNATLAVIGGVTKARALRTLRQLLGPWRKSEQVVPTTFRQPKAPDTRTLIVSGPGPSVEVRLAMRGTARSDPDFYPATILSRIAQQRWAATTPVLITKPLFARSDSFTLPGMFVFGTTVESTSVVDSINGAKKVIESLVSNPPTAAELERARADVIGEISNTIAKPDAQPDPWLDFDTYRLSTIQKPNIELRTVSTADLQRVATRLFKDPLVATVVVGDPLQLKPALNGHLQFEVFGEIPATMPPPKPPTKPGATNTPD